MSDNSQLVKVMQEMLKSMNQSMDRQTELTKALVSQFKSSETPNVTVAGNEAPASLRLPHTLNAAPTDQTGTPYVKSAISPYVG